MRYILFLFLQPVLIMAKPPDLILTNGRIFTDDTTQLYVEALAICWIPVRVLISFARWDNRVGYYDQEHLINKFSYFAGSLPRLYQ